MARDRAVTTLTDALMKLGTADIDLLRLDGFRGSTDEQVVRDWTQYQYSGASNQLLAELVEFVTGQRVIVEGVAEVLHPCPCCGLRTLTQPDDYDICRWCNWEDDGTHDTSRTSSVNGGASIADYRDRLRDEQRLVPMGRWMPGFDIDATSPSG